MKVIGYTRFSEMDAVSHLKWCTLEFQAARIEEYCLNHQIDLVDIKQDTGCFDAMDSDCFVACLQIIKTNKLDGLVVFSTDRLSNDVRVWQYLLESFFDEYKLLSVIGCNAIKSTSNNPLYRLFTNDHMADIAERLINDNIHRQIMEWIDYMLGQGFGSQSIVNFIITEYPEQKGNEIHLFFIIAFIERARKNKWDLNTIAYQLNTRSE